MPKGLASTENQHIILRFLSTSYFTMKQNKSETDPRHLEPSGDTEYSLCRSSFILT